MTTPNNATWDVRSLETIDFCPVCGDSSKAILHDNLMDGLFGAPGVWRLYQCQNCQSAYLNPRPTKPSIGQAYENYYTHTGEWRKEAGQLSLIKKFFRSLSNGYFNQRFGTRFAPATVLGVFLAYLAPIRRARLLGVGRHLPKVSGSGRLLDIGCGNGFFLEFAQSAGWDAQGVDFDPAAVAACVRKGLNVVHGGIEQFDDQAGCFDWITLSHVIEHVHDPLKLLAACLRLLKANGTLWIETPNINALGHRNYGAAWRGLEPPRHLVLFHRQSLLRALKSVGFSRVEDAPFRPLYKDLAEKSTAIRENRNPYQHPQKMRLTPQILLADLRAWRDPNLREFITLTAHKTP